MHETLLALLRAQVPEFTRQRCEEIAQAVATNPVTTLALWGVGIAPGQEAPQMQHVVVPVGTVLTEVEVITRRFRKLLLNALQQQFYPVIAVLGGFGLIARGARDVPSTAGVFATAHDAAGNLVTYLATVESTPAGWRTVEPVHPSQSAQPQLCQLLDAYRDLHREIFAAWLEFEQAPELPRNYSLSHEPLKPHEQN